MYYQKIEELELLRKKTLRIFLICLAACVIPVAAAILLIAIDFNAAGYAFICFAVFFAAFVFSVFFYRPAAAKFRTAFRDIIVKDVLTELTGLMTYLPDGGFKKEEVAAFIDTGDSFSGGNYIEASYRNIYFRCAEGYSSSSHTDSDNNTSTTVHFSGIFYMFVLPFRAGDLWLKDRAGKFGLKPRFNEIKTGRAETDGRFKIYAYDKETALNLFRSAFADFVSELSARAVKGVNIYIRDNCLYVAVNNGKYFGLLKPKLFRRIDGEARGEAAGQVEHILEVPGVYAKYYGGHK